MKTESEIRQMLAILRAFNRPDKRGVGIHDLEIIALLWTLGEYPPAEATPAEVPEGLRDAVQGFHIKQPMGVGGFAVRGVPVGKSVNETIG